MSQQIGEHRINNQKPEILLDDRKIFRCAEELLNKDYMYYPYRDQIHIIHTVTENGIYQRIYWLDHSWEQMENSAWNIRRKSAGVHSKSRVCKFCVTHYQKNTLLNPKPVYADGQTILYFCKDQLRPDRIRNVSDELEKFRPEWLQLDTATAELLLEYTQMNYVSWNFQLKYIEIVNSGSTQLCQRMKEQFGCTVKRAWISAMFGVFAMENEQGVLELLADNVAVGISDGRAVFSTKQNLLMPVSSYLTNHKIIRKDNFAEEDALLLDLKESGNSRFLYLKNGCRLCSDLFCRPVEFINERVGRIISQIHITQKELDVFTVNMGLHSSYFGWKDEIQKMFCEYLYIQELSSVDYQFHFEEDLLGEEGYFFTNELEREQDGTE